MKRLRKLQWTIILIFLILISSTTIVIRKVPSHDKREERMLELVDKAEQDPKSMLELKRLLAAGVNPNAVQPESGVSLQTQLNTVWATRNLGTLWYARSRYMSALDIACRATTLLHERYSFHSQLRPSTIKVLVEAGADVNRKDFAGYTPLVYAFYDNDASTARLMIEHGARATSDIYGYLHAVWRFPRGTFDPHLVDLGLQAGARVDGLTLAQERPLYEALERGNVQLTAELLKHGANIHLTGRSRQTPIMLARSILSRKSSAYNAQSQIDAARLVLASTHGPR